MQHPASGGHGELLSSWESLLSAAPDGGSASNSLAITSTGVEAPINPPGQLYNIDGISLADAQAAGLLTMATGTAQEIYYVDPAQCALKV